VQIVVHRRGGVKSTELGRVVYRIEDGDEIEIPRERRVDLGEGSMRIEKGKSCRHLRV